MGTMQRYIFNSTNSDLTNYLLLVQDGIFWVENLFLPSRYFIDPEKQTEASSSSSSSLNSLFCFPPVSVSARSSGSISFSTMTSSVLAGGPDSWSLTGVIITCGERFTESSTSCSVGLQAGLRIYQNVNSKSVVENFHYLDCGRRFKLFG